MDAVLWALVLVALVLSAAWLGKDPSRPDRAPLHLRHRRTANDGAVDRPAGDAGDGARLADQHDIEAPDARAPGDRPEGPSDATLFGPFLSPSGAILAIPEPLTAGPSRPEPDEPWTLAPGTTSEPSSSTAGGAAEHVTAEPVRADVRPAPDQRIE